MDQGKNNPVKGNFIFSYREKSTPGICLATVSSWRPHWQPPKIRHRQRKRLRPAHLLHRPWCLGRSTSHKPGVSPSNITHITTTNIIPTTRTSRFMAKGPMDLRPGVTVAVGHITQRIARIAGGVVITCKASRDERKKAWRKVKKVKTQYVLYKSSLIKNKLKNQPELNIFIFYFLPLSLSSFKSLVNSRSVRSGR